MADQPYLNAAEASSRLWDAIVVGAGPAGCAAAYDLAAAGRSVLLLDKSSFPRPKACAGGLTVKAVKTLRYSIDPVVREVITQIHLEGAAGFSSSLTNREPTCAMTVRAEFDEFCLGKTIAAGAHFRRISRLQQVVYSSETLYLHTPEGTFETRFLVGADGANGQVRRLCAQGSWFTRGFALEVQTPKPSRPVGLTFDFAAVSGGYAWIFPKHDHLNVGVYSASSATGLNRDRLLSYVKAKLGMEAGDHVTGQYLGFGAGECQAECVQLPLRGRVFLVGDAGGFADPLTGEGIYGALHSGQAAAKAILDETRGNAVAADAFAAYVSGYRQTLRFSSRAATAFYANPSRGFRAMRLPFVRRTMVKTYTHGLNVNSLAMRIALSRC
jgi:geranylgeranyl reductase family protein